MAFGYIGSMRTKPGHRDDVVAILTSGQAGLKTAGCQVYAVGLDPEDEDKIWVSEIWESAEHHAGSLQLPETKAAIAAALPLLTGEFSGQKVEIVGGLGVS